MNWGGVELIFGNATSRESSKPYCVECKAFIVDAIKKSVFVMWISCPFLSRYC